MNRALDLLPAEVEGVRAVWSGPDAASLSDSDLVAVNERYCRMQRMLDADRAQLAAEIARRPVPSSDLGVWPRRKDSETRPR